MLEFRGKFSAYTAFIGAVEYAFLPDPAVEEPINDAPLWAELGPFITRLEIVLLFSPLNGLLCVKLDPTNPLSENFDLG